MGFSHLSLLPLASFLAQLPVFCDAPASSQDAPVCLILAPWLTSFLLLYRHKSNTWHRREARFRNRNGRIVPPRREEMENLFTLLMHFSFPSRLHPSSSVMRLNLCPRTEYSYSLKKNCYGNMGFHLHPVLGRAIQYCKWDVYFTNKWLDWLNLYPIFPNIYKCQVILQNISSFDIVLQSKVFLHIST